MIAIILLFVSISKSKQNQKRPKVSIVLSDTLVQVWLRLQKQNTQDVKRLQEISRLMSRSGTGNNDIGQFSG